MRRHAVTHRRAIALAAMGIAMLVANPAPADDDGPVRLSLPTESDRAAWRRDGFRLQLGAVFGDLEGLGGAPGGLLYGVVLRIGVRLDEGWSLLGSFHYSVASREGGLSGLRFTGTLDPTWHVTRNLSLAVGLGFGGLAEGDTGRPDADPLMSTLETSYTFPDAHHPVPSCSGIGVAALARADYLLVLGPRASTGLAVEVSGQWTGCIEEDEERVEPDTAQPIARRQYWPHVGGTVAWVVAWR